MTHPTSTRNSSDISLRDLFTIKISALFVCLIMLNFSGMESIAQVTPVKIGNPTLVRYPVRGNPAFLNSDSSALERSVWDMYYFNRRIYIGSGDWVKNCGPIDIWTYNGTTFEKEYTVDEESVVRFFEYDNKLFIPGNDPANGDDWSFGNLYINDPARIPNPGWIKLRTLPNCIHLFDIAMFRNKLYAPFNGNIYMSADMGQTWTTFHSQVGSLVVFPDFLFIHGSDYDIKYDGITKEWITSLNIFPDFANSGQMARSVRYRDGVLYTPRSLSLETNPLFFLHASDIKNSGEATMIRQFAKDNIRDIVVRGNFCFVLTTKEVVKDITYSGRILYSVDLINWVVAAAFVLPGLPYSFEIMDGKYYIGLGCTVNNSLGNEITFGLESGSIWEIGETSIPVGISDTEMATGYSLNQNFPNPFDGSTNISFDLPAESDVLLKVFNFLGNEVATIVDEKLPPGKYSRIWETGGIPGGIYFYQLKAGTFTSTRKLVLLR